MSEPKWTPGPWAVQPDYRAGMAYNNHIVIEQDPDQRICFMAHGGPARHLEFTANASLIAAAPELYEALGSIITYGELGCVEAGGEFYPPGGKKPPTKDVWQFPRHMLTKIETALAKARGDV